MLHGIGRSNIHHRKGLASSKKVTFHETQATFCKCCAHPRRDLHAKRCPSMPRLMRPPRTYLAALSTAPGPSPKSVCPRGPRRARRCGRRAPCGRAAPPPLAAPAPSSARRTGSCWRASTQASLACMSAGRGEAPIQTNGGSGGRRRSRRRPSQAHTQTSRTPATGGKTPRPQAVRRASFEQARREAHP